MDQLESALDLMRRMPPGDVEENLGGLLDLVPDLTEDLLSAVDQPLKVANDPASGRDYLLCDYNRDGDSYRSPWSNQYDPPLDDGAVPSDTLRQLEVEMNQVFDVYRDMYYEGGVSSVYTWDLDDGFAACILIKKVGDVGGRQKVHGSWDSIHVVEVNELGGGKANYKLTTTVMLGIDLGEATGEKTQLAGSLTRQSEQEFVVNEQNPHVVNMGKIVEDMELKLRNSLEQIYFGKTKDICNGLRKHGGLTEARRREQAQGQVATGLKQR